MALPDGVTIRRGVPAEAEALAQLHLDVWDDAYTGLMPQEILDEWVSSGSAHHPGAGRVVRSVKYSNRSDTPGSCPTSDHRLSATQAGLLAPHRVEYSLTDLCEQIADRLQGLADLLEGSVEEMTEARRRYDSRQG